MLSKFKTVYVLAPHTDDGELGAGATIAKLIEEGANVYYFAFSTAETSVPEGFPKDILKTEVIDATAKLGIAKAPRPNMILSQSDCCWQFTASYSFQISPLATIGISTSCFIFAIQSQ